MLRFLSIAMLALALTGCQALPEVNTTVTNVPMSTQKINAQLGNVTVVIAEQDERRGYMRPEVSALTPQWGSSVVDALTQSGVFTSSAQHVWNVRVKILQLNYTRNADLSVTTHVIASYEVIDPASGELKWIRGISTSSTASYQEAIVQSTRERLSLNRAIQANISQFVQLLGQGQAQSQPVPESQFRFQQ